ncbi:hypothetical protein Nans01_46100 [Nocardiopsis ansamitocini]|uniref:Uncharacterized protein n=1 Tax=Nocardiopsis ansamitocini TaxID=1670832 RepID=A0A9W6PAZ8_9ACTN|nr:hypothetical protein Nans01_46100 [Nocardiopsis ansamitocini]
MNQDRRGARQYMVGVDILDGEVVDPLLTNSPLKELLGHARIGVTAGVYAHVRLRLQRQAIDALGNALDVPGNDESTRDNGDDPPLCGATVH